MSSYTSPEKTEETEILVTKITAVSESDLFSRGQCEYILIKLTPN